METKKLFLFICVTLTMLLSVQFVRAQLPIDPETGKVKFTAIVDIPETSKDKIYQKVKLWIVSTLKSGDNMVQLSGDNSDQIVGTGNIILDSIEYTQNPCLNFKFIVFCKDNKLKYSIENIILHYDYFVGYTRLTMETGLEEIKSIAPTKKRILEFQKKTSNYLKRVLDNIIVNFITSVKKEENNNW